MNDKAAWSTADNDVVCEPDDEFPDWLRTYSTKRYLGITHGVWFGQARSTPLRMAHDLLLHLRRRRCRRGIHAFDEVAGHGHYLHCDTCGLMVHIARIEVT